MPEIGLNASWYAAQIGDLLRDAEAKLPREEYRTVIALLVMAVAKRTADEIEREHQQRSTDA